MKTEVKTTISLSLITILTILSILQVYLLNRYSTSGDQQTSLLTNIKQIGDENNELTQKIASASSIVSISNKAAQAGFSTNNKTFALTKPLPVAYTRSYSL